MKKIATALMFCGLSMSVGPVSAALPLGASPAPAGGTASTTPAPAARTASTSPASTTGPTVLPMGGSPFGQKYEQWAADATKLLYSIPLANNPFLSDIGKCTVSQYGKVWFVGTKSSDASCEVPFGKAILLEFGGYVDTYPCPDPNFHPKPGQTLEKFLIKDARYIVDNYLIAPGLVPHGLKIDGNQALSHDEVLNQRRLSTKLFHLTGDLSLQAVDSCVTGTSQEAVTDDFWAIVTDMPLGSHTLEFVDVHGVITSTIHLNIYDDAKP